MRVMSSPRSSLRRTNAFSSVRISTDASVSVIKRVGRQLLVEGQQMLLPDRRVKDQLRSVSPVYSP
jgi:hypothetical protein